MRLSSPIKHDGAPPPDPGLHQQRLHAVEEAPVELLLCGQRLPGLGLGPRYQLVRVAEGVAAIIDI